jgi:hypothetical protein
MPERNSHRGAQVRVLHIATRVKIEAREHRADLFPLDAAPRAEGLRTLGSAEYLPDSSLGY